MAAIGLAGLTLTRVNKKATVLLNFALDLSSFIETMKSA